MGDILWDEGDSLYWLEEILYDLVVDGNSIIRGRIEVSQSPYQLTGHFFMIAILQH